MNDSITQRVIGDLVSIKRPIFEKRKYDIITIESKFISEREDNRIFDLRR